MMGFGVMAIVFVELFFEMYERDIRQKFGIQMADLGTPFSDNLRVRILDITRHTYSRFLAVASIFLV